MKYKIESKSDIITGASLIVKIPEEDLDTKSLNTILAEKPEFSLPFRHKSIDGNVEFTYQIGVQNKLRYLSGSRTPREYAELWASILTPLINCGDWFMKPYSFVLSAEHLYFDRNKKAICFVYIPSKKGYSNFDMLREMAVEVSRMITVPDANLENRVLRAIMKDFNPDDFLQMLKPYMSTSQSGMGHENHQTNNPNEAPIIAPSGLQSHKAPVIAAPEPQSHKASITAASEPKSTYPLTEQESDYITPGDIIINIPTETASGKKEKEKKKTKEKRSAKKEKTVPKASKHDYMPKQRKGLSALFCMKKSDCDVEAATSSQPVQNKVQPTDPAQPLALMPINSAASHLAPEEVRDDTQSISTSIAGAGLKYIGYSDLPQKIEVRIAAGEVFTIGRFDSAVGRQQSSFEFDKKTKAVSRRHAVIERNSAGYRILDLSSSAGTFVNEHKLPPNTPCELEKNCRVSFGNSGADYVWEQ